jgi:hypothetical protein
MASKSGSDKMMAKVGVWSYIGGLVIAALLGVLAWANGSSMQGWSVILLAVLGLIVGLLNISDSEVNTFLLGAVAFVIASASMGVVFSTLSASGAAWASGLAVFMNAITVFTAPGALVVAFKALYKVAKDD